MLGGASEAEDAVQETMLRAWRAVDDDQITGICHFLDTSIFPAFDLPPHLTA